MNRSFTSLGSFARFCRRVAVGHRHEVNAGLVAVAGNIHRHAYKVIGDATKLEPLQGDTISEKTRRGYPHPSAPLEATGEMRDSLEMAFEPGIGDLIGEAGVGSSDIKLLWHHQGTSRGVPPRPVLTIAAIESEAQNVALITPFIERSLGLSYRYPRLAQGAIAARRLTPQG